MENLQNFIEKFENTMVECWDNQALNDYGHDSITYGELAREIAMLHLIWKKAGLNEGDKVALNAASSASWAKVFMAAMTGKYVSCQLFNGFTPQDTQKLTVHSDSRILYTEKGIFDKMDVSTMPDLIAIFDTKTQDLLYSRNGFEEIYNNREQLFAQAYPNGYRKEDLKHCGRSMEDTCCIMYTSGSTGFPKGVMISAKNISMNVWSAPQFFPFRRGENYLSVLPYAHIFGLTIDMIMCLSTGMHLTVLGLPPIPQILKKALCEVRPHVCMMVPLILEKMTEYAIGDFIHTPKSVAKLENPAENRDFCDALRTIFISAMGGNLEVMATGGAPLRPELESLLAEKIEFPLVTGYGMTECAPLIALGRKGDYKLKSCGYVTPKMQVNIQSSDPTSIAGELWVKGDYVFQGYYKNPAADKEVFTEDGWFKTGDLGTLDAEGHLFLVGRCKSMLLASNGQNVFPEEIETVLNAKPYIAESIIVQRENQFVALIVPNADLAVGNNLDSATMQEIIRQNVDATNKEIPAYSQISKYEIMNEPFAKTPKGSIKRFLYS